MRHLYGHASEIPLHYQLFTARIAATENLHEFIKFNNPMAFLLYYKFKPLRISDWRTSMCTLCARNKFPFRFWQTCKNKIIHSIPVLRIVNSSPAIFLLSLSLSSLSRTIVIGIKFLRRTFVGDKVLCGPVSQNRLLIYNIKKRNHIQVWNFNLQTTFNIRYIIRNGLVISNGILQLDGINWRCWHTIRLWVRV